jgi:glutaredoxin
MTIKVYGADWCGDTKRTLKQLDDLNIDYDYIDVEQDETASEWVKSQNAGKERKPTLLIGSNVLSVPNENQLKAALKQEGLIS